MTIIILRMARGRQAVLRGVRGGMGTWYGSSADSLQHKGKVIAAGGRGSWRKGTRDGIASLHNYRQ